VADHFAYLAGHGGLLGSAEHHFFDGEFDGPADAGVVGDDVGELVGEFRGEAQVADGGFVEVEVRDLVGVHVWLPGSSFPLTS
jgi:hypothetical protein